jgi:uncharacterized protein
MRDTIHLWSIGKRAIYLLVIAALAQAQNAPEIDGIPGTLSWHNQPAAYHVEGRSALTISSGPKTDWFVDPFDETMAPSAPILSFVPGDTFVFSAKVQVVFRTKWDAGALMLWADDHHWAKLSFELSPEGRPTMVTVVTSGVSDDCNSVPLPGDSVYLQIARTKSTYVFYYSTHGTSWNILRTFRLETQDKVSVGFESQSPAGTGSRAVFSEIRYSPKKIANIYTGK